MAYKRLITGLLRPPPGSGQLGLGKSEWWRIRSSGTESTPRLVSALKDHKIVAASAGALPPSLGLHAAIKPFTGPFDPL
eukprot:4175095-Pyramimonas_sp.AAC.1